MNNNNNVPEIRFEGFNDSWEQRKLGEVFNFHYGEGNNNPSNGGQYPVFGAGGIQGGYTKYNAENSIIIGHMGDAGCVSWGEGKHFVTYNGTITKPKDDVFSAKFGYYLLLNMNLRKYRGGSGLPFLTYDMLTEMETKCPNSKFETQKIANYFSYLDHLITLHQSKYEKLLDLKESMLYKLFPKEGKTVPDIRFEGFTDEWEKKKLLEFGESTSGVSMESEFNKNGQLKIISIGSYSENSKYIDQGIRSSINNKTSNRILSKEDLTMILNDKTASGNIIGRVLLIEENNKYIYNQRTERIEIYKEKFNPNFLYQMLNSNYIRSKIIKLAQGNTQIYVNWSTIKEIEYLIPRQYNEQKAIGEYFSKLDKLIDLNKAKLEKLKNIKSSLLDNMFV
jgi:Restriction endonuclease S subunits